MSRDDLVRMPDFDALRAERNASYARSVKQLCEELGWSVADVYSSYDPDACYCNCPDGPCEHKWDGDPWQSEDGLAWSTTCSRCGQTSMSHDLRCAP